MQNDFEGKVVIVTGSSSGIGEAIAILFAKRGANVTLHGRDQERLQAAMEKCQEAAGGGSGAKKKFISVCGDITDKGVREKLVDDTVKQFGQLDVLVCNHGTVNPVFDIKDETDETYDTVMNINLKSVYFLIQKSVPYLEKTQGSIINISSIASSMAGAGPVCYSMSKAAMDHMTRCLALQLAPKGIRVNSVNPTGVATRIARHWSPDAMKGASDVAALHPLHGRMSTPEEQAEVTVFLASAGASFVTGEIIKVDGGMSMRGAFLK